MKKKASFQIIMIFITSAIYAQQPSPFIDATNGILLGGSDKGGLINTDEIKPLVKGGESYKLYDLKGYIKTVEGDKPESMGPPCDATYLVTTPFKAAEGGYFVTGISCNWDPYPKTLKITSPNQKVYQDITEKILTQYHIKDPVIELTGVIRTDLENDGVEEVLVSATHFTNGLTPSGLEGDYSMVYLRKIINGKPENIVIESNTYSKTIESVIPSRFKIANILDLDNDGMMEIIIYSEYYEGYSFSVYKITDNKPVMVLSAGCGV